MKKFLLLVFLVICVAAISGCSTAAPATSPAAAPPTAQTGAKTSSTPKYGGTMKVLWSINASVLGYPPDADSNTGSANRAIVDCLTWDDKNGTPSPRLATKWEISPDGKAVTYTLRQGVKFHDGTDFNADAVKWNYDIVLAAKPYNLSPMTSVDVVDPYTVRINLSSFSNAIFNTLSFASIVSPTAVQKNGKEWARVNPVGTGPFKFTDFKPQTYVKVVKNTNYWQQGKPYLDGINFDYVADKTVGSIAFEKGSADVQMQLTEQIASDLQKKGFTIRSMPGSSYFLACDSANKDSPYANLKVREAVEYALNKDELVKAIGYGFMLPSYQLAPDNIAGHNFNLQDRKYDPAKAKQLLKDAGYPNGFKTSLIAQNTMNQDQVVAMQTFLKEVGIDASLDIIDAAKWAEYRTKGWKNGLALARTGLDPNMNQQLARDLPVTGTYPNMAKPEKWGPTLDQSVAARTIEERKAKVEQMMQMAHDEVFTIPVWYACDLVALSKGVNTDMLITHHVQWKPEEVWLGN
jgi:peptide/nickel transport system substrate-binding protein